MGKIFKSIINKRLVFQSEAADIVDPNQLDFRKGCRTSDNVFIIDSLITYYKSIRKTLYITFIDFSKASDFVNRTFLYSDDKERLWWSICENNIKQVQSVLHTMLLFSKSSAQVRWQGEFLWCPGLALTRSDFF